MIEQPDMASRTQTKHRSTYDGRIIYLSFLVQLLGTCVLWKLGSVATVMGRLPRDDDREAAQATASSVGGAFPVGFPVLLGSETSGEASCITSSF